MEFVGKIYVSVPVRALSEGPGTFRRQHQNTGNDNKTIEIMEIMKSEGRKEMRIGLYESHNRFLSIAKPPGPQIP